MKLNDFKSGSTKSSFSTIHKRLGRESEIKFVNDTKEAEYQKQVDSLTKQVVTLDSIKAELGTAKVQRQEAVEAKTKAENDFNDLKSKFTVMANSFNQYEKREPQIKKIIEQHRDLNGQVAELQSKLQLVIEEHDAKIDALNDKIIIIDTLKETLHKAELAETKATQGKLEAVMEKEVIEQNLDSLTKKYDALGIINQEAKDKLSEARHDRNVFEAISKQSNEERDKAVALAQRLQERGEKLEAKTSSTNSTSKTLIEENNTLKSEITEMTSAIKDLTEELLFVSKENKEMLAELKKPRFASIASISKIEGIKFAASFEPRANSLGTGKPTLLRKKD